MSLVELRNVSKIYRLGDEEIRALDDISLDIEEGELISIIGPSGSGKSTLMHILGCLDSPTHGTIRLDGTMIQDASPRQLAAIRNRKIGFVFQFFNLLPKLNVVQNVELPMIYSGVSGKERPHRAMAALAAVDLANRAGTAPASFPADNNNAWQSLARWSTAPASCSPMNQPATWIRIPATRYCNYSANSAAKAARSSWSRTIPKSPPSRRVESRSATARSRSKPIRPWPGWIALTSFLAHPFPEPIPGPRPLRTPIPPRAGDKLPVSNEAFGPAVTLRKPRAIFRLFITIQTGLREIWAHKFRSLLTMLGIILGVSSLIAMSALVAGMEKGASEALVAIGGL